MVNCFVSVDAFANLLTEKYELDFTVMLFRPDDVCQSVREALDESSTSLF